MSMIWLTSAQLVDPVLEPSCCIQWILSVSWRTRCGLQPQGDGLDSNAQRQLQANLQAWRRTAATKLLRALCAVFSWTRVGGTLRRALVQEGA